MDVTAGACRGEPGSPRGWGEAAGQRALGAVPGPLWGRLLGGSGVNWDVLPKPGWHRGSRVAGGMLCGRGKPSFPAGPVMLTFPVPGLAGFLLRETLWEGEQDKKPKTFRQKLIASFVAEKEENLPG